MNEVLEQGRMAETVYVGRGQEVRGMPGLEYKRPDYTVSPEPSLWF